jgi:hypothetical protein
VAVGAVAFPRTVTHTATVYATTTTGLPAGCVQAMALTGSLENAVGRKQVEQITAQFEAAAAGCEIPSECKRALTFFRRIATVHTRAEMLDLTHGFSAARAACRGS